MPSIWLTVPHLSKPFQIPTIPDGSAFISMILELWEQLNQLCLVNVNKMKQGGRQFFIWSHQNIEKIKNSDILSTSSPLNSKQNKHKLPSFRKQLTWAFGDSKVGVQSQSRDTWTLLCCALTGLAAATMLPRTEPATDRLDDSGAFLRNRL